MDKLYIENNIGPNALPCEIPVLMSKSEDRQTDRINLFVKLQKNQLYLNK